MTFKAIFVAKAGEETTMAKYMSIQIAFSSVPHSVHLLHR